MTTYTTRPDDRFYWVTENEDGTFSATPMQLEDREEVDEQGNPLYVRVFDRATNSIVNTSQRLIYRGLKSKYIAEAKQTANSMLALTDWTVIRKIERGVDIPADVATYRAAILAEATRLETAITAVTTVEELIPVTQTQNWPTL